MFGGLRKRLALEEAHRRGFEDGISGAETEPLWMTAEEKVAYGTSCVRGRAAAEHIERRILRALGKKGVRR
jgi:hypothetical protein